MLSNLNLPSEMRIMHYFTNILTGSGSVQELVHVITRKQGWGTARVGLDLREKKICLNGKTYEGGIGTHADSELLVKSTVPLERFRAAAGIEDFHETRKRDHQVIFSVEVSGEEIWRSPVMRVGDKPAGVDVALNGAKEFVLKTRELKGNWDWAHLAWGDATVRLENRTDYVFGGPSDQGFLLDTPPISFKYGGAPFSELFPRWSKKWEKKKLNDDVTLHTIVYTDPETGLQCTFEMKQYFDFPAVDWVVRFKNIGTKDTSILSEIQPLDLSWMACHNPEVYHSKGSGAQIDDYLFLKKRIGFYSPAHFETEDGRSSSVKCLPFFNLAQKDQGLMVAVGWTGQWAADFKYDGYVTNLRAGMEKTHFLLHPGEEIRTPSIVLLYWQGEDPIRGHNQFRRMVLKHYTYKPDGKAIPAPICLPHWGGMRTDLHIERIKFYEKMKLDYDYYWIDAAWYGPEGDYCPDVYTGNWSENTGYWEPNPTAHPKGLRPIADALHERGKKFLLWFEPERAIKGTPWTKEHPEWFLSLKARGPDYRNLLFNLGNPEARKWFIDEISRRIREWGVDCYRQDFNIGPLPFWREADAPDCQGMTEIRHIEGLYEFWDELLKRHPGLIIDNCASGGRRIDIETTRRSLPLHRSDYIDTAAAEPTGPQVHTYGLAHWVPCCTTGTGYRPHDTFNFRSSLCTGIAFVMYACDYLPIQTDDPHDWHRAMIAQARRAIPFFLGDYYPLKDGTVSFSDWMAYQMHREDLAGGVIVIFRREQSPFPTAIFTLRGLDENATYEFEDIDTGQKTLLSAASIKTNGWTITLDKKRESRLIFYRETNI